MTTKLRKTTWNTYARRGYTHDVANDQASAGGVHLHQVRWNKAGWWERRILQSNGRHSASGPVETLTDTEGESYFSKAQQEL
jgi:hypothetical protein